MDKAINAFKRGIEVDIFAEEFYHYLMTSYQRLGRRAEAIAIYNNLKKVLSATLSASPSPATEAIFRGIVEDV